MSNVGGDAAKCPVFLSEIKSWQELSKKTNKNTKKNTQIVKDCLSKQIFGRNLPQPPSHLNFLTFSVTSKHFSNHDKNIMQVSCVKSSRFNHSHKKLHSLETCPRLLFMLLQDFFASARLHRVHKNFCCRKV